MQYIDNALKMKIEPKDLADLMLKRAEAHARRVVDMDARITALVALVHRPDRKIDSLAKPKRHWWQRDRGGVVCFSDNDEVDDTLALVETCAEAKEVSDETKILLARMERATVGRIGHAIQDARDRRHMHGVAADWLKFTALHLDLGQPISMRVDDQFLAYLLDVDHPTAMPNSFHERRGVQ